MQVLRIQGIERQLVGLTKADSEVNNTITRVSDKAATGDEQWRGLASKGLASIEAGIKKAAEDQSDSIGIT